MKLALDANILIYAIETQSPFSGAASTVVRQAPLHGHETLVSELALLEVLSMPGISDAEAELAWDNLAASVTSVCTVSRTVLRGAAKLRRTYGLRTPDALHIASALEAKADFFVTNDRQLWNIQLPDLVIAGLDDKRIVALVR